MSIYILSPLHPLREKKGYERKMILQPSILHTTASNFNVYCPDYHPRGGYNRFLCEVQYGVRWEAWGLV